MFPGKTVMDKEGTTKKGRLVGQEYVYNFRYISYLEQKRGIQFFSLCFRKCNNPRSSFFLHSIIYRNFIFNILLLLVLYLFLNITFSFFTLRKRFFMEIYNGQSLHSLLSIILSFLINNEFI